MSSDPEAISEGVVADDSRADGEDRETVFVGVPVSGGIAIGPPFFLEPSQDGDVSSFPIAATEVDREIQRYRRALSSSRNDLEKLQQALASEGAQEAVTILDAHIQILQDPLITKEIEERIRLLLLNTETVFRTTMQEFTRRFSSHANQFFRQRLVDVGDVSKRVLSYLSPRREMPWTDLPSNAVVCAQEIAPSDSASAQLASVNGFVSFFGGSHSHTALIARAKGIPYVVHIDVGSVRKLAAQCLIVDGNEGKVIMNPTDATLRKYSTMLQRSRLQDTVAETTKTLPAETIDGWPVRICVNISGITDIDHENVRGAHGAGLVRTEMLFGGQNTYALPEDVQVAVFSKVIKKMAGMPVVLRLFDFGGDKAAPEGFYYLTEANPLLGCRGIRLLLKQKEFFKTHLRAMLRAAVGGDVRVLIPLVSDVHEIHTVRGLMTETSQELGAKGIEHVPVLPLGSMLEVPSAVLMADLFAQACDFLSLGTNDLVQYALGIDRGNPIVGDYYQPTHPSILRLIQKAVEAATSQRKLLSLCGEMASNPLYVPLLLGLGVYEFSCAPRFMPAVKRMVRQCTIVEARALARRVMKLGCATAVSSSLLEYFRKITPET